MAYVTSEEGLQRFRSSELAGGSAMRFNRSDTPANVCSIRSNCSDTLANVWSMRFRRSSNFANAAFAVLAGVLFTKQIRHPFVKGSEPRMGLTDPRGRAGGIRIPPAAPGIWSMKASGPHISCGVNGRSRTVRHVSRGTSSQCRIKHDSLLLSKLVFEDNLQLEVSAQGTWE